MLQVQAFAPLFIVRAAHENGKVRVQAADGAGRNFPHFAAFVSVVQVGEKLKFAHDPKPPHDNEKKLDQEGIVLLRPQKESPYLFETESPYLFEIDEGRWPNDASMVLVLFGYLQARGIGGTTRPPKKSSNAPSSGKFGTTVDAIREALEVDLVDDLRGGLIDGNLAHMRQQLQGAYKADSASPNVKFAVASCHYPSDILDNMPDGRADEPGPADASLIKLGCLLRKEDPPTLLLLAGDQVYTDATAGLFDPKGQNNRYRIPFERRGQSRGAKAIQRIDLRVEMTLDDHEIRDNWAPNDPDAETLLKDGKKAYFKYERMLATPSTPSDPVWRAIDHKDIPFFLGDARTEREARTALTWRTARIMRKRQCYALLGWMAKHETVPKFVMTASALLPRRLAVARDSACGLHSDAWDGYPFSQHALLAYACENEIKGLVFLSGDEHISSFTTATITHEKSGKKCTLHSIHSSAIYAPYPFANGGPEDFAEKDGFDFDDPADKAKGPYRCEATATFPELGDGFAVVTARASKGRWALDVRFRSAKGVKPDGEFLDVDLGLSWP